MLSWRRVTMMQLVIPSLLHIQALDPENFTQYWLHFISQSTSHSDILEEGKLIISQAQLQTRYATHRNTRNGQQKEKLLSPEFSGLIIDPILERLMNPSIEPGFVDPRNCLVFWARPPSHIRSLVDQVQQKLLTLAPSTFIRSPKSSRKQRRRKSSSLKSSSSKIFYPTPTLQLLMLSSDFHTNNNQNSGSCPSQTSISQPWS